MNMFGFGKSGDALVEIFLDDNGRKAAQVKDRMSKDPETSQKLNVFQADDKVTGRIEIKLDKKRRLDHNGIKIELLGLIETNNDKILGSTFMSNATDLESPGSLSNDQLYPFTFAVFQKPYDSYYGQSVKLRYVVRATISRGKMSGSIVKEQDLYVIAKAETGDFESVPIKMEVGIEDCLNININIPKNVFGLKDCILGQITFGQVKVQVQKMELNLVRKETLGSGEGAITTVDEFHSFEIMDGCPSKAEEIPVRMFLGGVTDLTPSMTGINNKFSVKYFLNLVIIDDLKRRYFKQSEIRLIREAA